MVYLHYSPEWIEDALRDEKGVRFFPPISDRTAWRQVHARLGRGQIAAFIHQAEQASGQAIPPLPGSLWLDCMRTGRREGYEEACYLRRLMLRDLAIGECLEGQGRFLDPLLDLIWAICEESSWVYPAHHPDLPVVDQPYIDLGAASTGFDLAVVDGLVGSALPPQAGRRIREEVERRLLTPYLEREDFWWLAPQRGRPLNNWTAVCNAGVMAAALYLEADPTRLATLLAKGLHSLAYYLDTFDEDGGTTEGPGYWAYGFGYFARIAQMIEQCTGGRITLLDGERVRKVGAFPLRTMLSPGLYVNFSDAPRRATFPAALLATLGRRLNLPSLLALAAEPVNQAHAGLNADLLWLLPTLFWDLPAPGSPGIELARHDWFNGMMWMIARADPCDPDGLVLAAKGGHNDEMHNHNDVGSFIVQVAQEALIADPGSGHYTLDYFSSRRYEHLAASSLGHSVPVPNGQIQQPGRAFAARVLEHSVGMVADVLRLDLGGAYPPEARLASLERRLALHRPAIPPGWSWKTVLLSWAAQVRSKALWLPLAR